MSVSEARMDRLYAQPIHVYNNTFLLRTFILKLIALTDKALGLKVDDRSSLEKFRYVDMKIAPPRGVNF